MRGWLWTRAVRVAKRVRRARLHCALETPLGLQAREGTVGEQEDVCAARGDRRAINTPGERAGDWPRAPAFDCLFPYLCKRTLS